MGKSKKPKKKVTTIYEGMQYEPKHYKMLGYNQGIDDYEAWHKQEIAKLKEEITNLAGALVNEKGYYFKPIAKEE